MVLEVEPPAEDLEATILRPSRSIVEPPRQLLDENLLTQVAQDFVDISVGVTLWDQVDRWLRTSSCNVKWRLVGSAVWSQSRNSSLGFTTNADRFSVTIKTPLTSHRPPFVATV